MAVGCAVLPMSDDWRRALPVLTSVLGVRRGGCGSVWCLEAEWGSAESCLTVINLKLGC